MGHPDEASSLPGTPADPTNELPTAHDVVAAMSAMRRPTAFRAAPLVDNLSSHACHDPRRSPSPNGCRPARPSPPSPPPATSAAWYRATSGEWGMDGKRVRIGQILEPHVRQVKEQRAAVCLQAHTRGMLGRRVADTVRSAASSALAQLVLAAQRRRIQEMREENEVLGEQVAFHSARERRMMDDDASTSDGDDLTDAGSAGVDNALLVTPSPDGGSSSLPPTAANRAPSPPRGQPPASPPPSPPPMATHPMSRLMRAPPSGAMFFDVDISPPRMRPARPDVDEDDSGSSWSAPRPYTSGVSSRVRHRRPDARVSGGRRVQTSTGSSGRALQSLGVISTLIRGGECSVLAPQTASTAASLYAVIGMVVIVCLAALLLLIAHRLWASFLGSARLCTPPRSPEMSQSSTPPPLLRPIPERTRPEPSSSWARHQFDCMTSNNEEVLAAGSGLTRRPRRRANRRLRPLSPLPWHGSAHAYVARPTADTTEAAGRMADALMAMRDGLHGLALEPYLRALAAALGTRRPQRSTLGAIRAVLSQRLRPGVPGQHRFDDACASSYGTSISNLRAWRRKINRTASQPLAALAPAPSPPPPRDWSTLRPTMALACVPCEVTGHVCHECPTVPTLSAPRDSVRFSYSAHVPCMWPELDCWVTLLPSLLHSLRHRLLRRLRLMMTSKSSHFPLMMSPMRLRPSPTLILSRRLCGQSLLMAYIARPVVLRRRWPSAVAYAMASAVAYALSRVRSWTARPAAALTRLLVRHPLKCEPRAPQWALAARAGHFPSREATVRLCLVDRQPGHCR